jgi:TolB-like protein
MGVVYAAFDERLSREIAVKMIVEDGADTLKRFWREARSAAAISHPNVCQVFDVQETAEGLMLAMERLSGESLDTRIKTGPLDAPHAARVGIEMLSALAVLHERGLVHRDIKPSNIFLTSHGAKLLDFGLARRAIGEDEALADASLAITQPGAMVGTPLYMAPEQITGEAIDGRADLHALGAVLYEAVAGRPPWPAANLMRLLYAVLHEKPPALEGPASIIALDRVIRRAMAKSAVERYPAAPEMAEELRPIANETAAIVVTRARALTRVIVLPFRLARPDPEIDFLTYSLAESLSTALTGTDGLLVRSTSVGAKLARGDMDLRRIGTEADVDRILMGTLLRSGQRIRVTLQLAEPHSRSIVRAATVQSEFEDVFALEDSLCAAARRLLDGNDHAADVADVGDSRAAATSAVVTHPTPPTPLPAHSTRMVSAFEHFLRGTELLRHMGALREANEQFEACVAADPTFARGWAGLGRACHLLAKFAAGHEDFRRRSEAAFQRALELNSHLALAHYSMTSAQTDSGRAEDAMARLLAEAAHARNDANLFAGLVHACRYAGLLEASMAAYDETMRLDPTVSTSIVMTLVAACEWERLDYMAGPRRDLLEPLLYGAGLLLQGRLADARQLYQRIDFSKLPDRYRQSLERRRAVAEGDYDLVRATPDHVILALRDPEAEFWFAALLAQAGEPSRALAWVTRAVSGGYAAVSLALGQPVFEGVRNESGFDVVVAEVAARRDRAATLFNRSGGPDLLGIPAIA